MSVQSKIAPAGAKTTNPKVLAFVEEAKALFKPEASCGATARMPNTSTC